MRREVEPFVGHTLSVIVGVASLMFAIWVDSRLALPASPAGGTSLTIPVGLATLLIGLVLIVSRRTAVTQVLGYIVVENGIYAVGVVLVGGVPLLVETGRAHGHLRRGVHHEHRGLPHQPRVRPH